MLFRRRPSVSSISFALAMTLCVTAPCVGMIACGQMKDRGDRVVVIHDAAPPVSSESGALSGGRVGGVTPELRQLQEFIDLYFDGGSISREGLTNLFKKYRKQIDAFLAGTGLSQEELIDIIFKFDGDHDGKISAAEVADGLSKRIPILRWIPDNSSAIGPDELKAAIAREYPDAAPQAHAGLRDTLMRLDETWAGGNGDGKVSRQELKMAGIIVGVLGQTDFSKPLSLGDGADETAERKLADGLGLKLDEQIYGRYSTYDHNELKGEDLKLEWMQMGLKVFLADKLTHGPGHDGLIAPAQQAAVLSLYGPAEWPHWDTVRSFYDMPQAGGDGDGMMNTIEAFNFLTEIEFAQKLWNHAHGQFDSQSIARLSPNDKSWFLGGLLHFVPHVGRALFLTSSRDEWESDHWAVNKAYWDGLVGDFDDGETGGDGDHRLDVAELLMAIDYARILDGVFVQYDKSPADGLLEKNEARPLFKDVAGITDKNVIDAFYADMGLDGRHKFWNWLKMHITGKASKNTLTPYEFHQRMVEVLPKVLKKEQL